MVNPTSPGQTLKVEGVTVLYAHYSTSQKRDMSVLTPFDLIFYNIFFAFLWCHRLFSPPNVFEEALLL